ncbi:hypothetical protein [Hymenobacter arizonensis]|uniref:Uncharacterized protein n=1 Tax=Hymenobacter arizonensis TaxID=1227077 RepID=A0A1I6BFF3_HYMAR|nr:hypothetical protein [Hymenobacter arizonensis]SFQ79695.1 hypothetical protein SAMN04515668_4483 [Hymenobacter arizonensis]
MANECAPPQVIPQLSTYLSGQTMLAAVQAAPPAGCSTTLTGADETNCQIFTTWTQYTASICGALGLAAQIIDREISGGISKEMVLAIEALYDGINGVNTQFLQAIVDINSHTPYEPLPTPDPIPPFPMPTSGSDVEQAVVQTWDMLKPWIEKSMDKLPTGSPWVKVLEGIIDSSDKMLADLQALFAQITGNTNPVASS